MREERATPYPLRWPGNLRQEAKQQAIKKRWSLHTYVLDAIEKKVDEDKRAAEAKESREVAA